MAAFKYRGRDRGGELVTGTQEAISVDALASQLLGRGITPIAITEHVEKQAFDLSTLFKQKVTLEELIMFSRQMHSLNRAGVAINQAIRGMSASVSNLTLREVLVDVGSTLNTGVTLSSAMRKHGEVFDDLYTNIVQVGENTGRLDLAFEQLAQYLTLEKDTRRRIKAAVRYPTFVLIAIAIAITVLNIWVIPVFADLFSRFDSELPLATKVLIATSWFFVNYWPAMIVGLVLLVFGVRYYLQTEGGERKWDYYKLKIPFIGSILERSMMARFGRCFAMMLSSGVPLIQALDLTAKAVGNRYIGEKISGMREGIQRGESLLRTSSQSQMFTPLVLQMIQVGEETGQVDELLGEVALFYEEEVDYDLKNLSSMIEPVLIVCIAGIVMVLAMGIFLPMWDMMSVMQK
ncbi:MAG: MSHA biogenesis protein MshG [Pseudohongiellaceae bacterium]|jgi:MSHA biogenesis protein MshG